MIKTQEEWDAFMSIRDAFIEWEKTSLEADKAMARGKKHKTPTEPGYYWAKVSTECSDWEVVSIEQSGFPDESLMVCRTGTSEEWKVESIIEWGRRIER